MPLETIVAACRASPGRSVDDGLEALVPRGDRPDGEERVERGDRAVGEIGRRQRLGGDAAGLRQLQRDLAGGRVLEPAADHEHAADERECGGDGAGCLLEPGEGLAEEGRDAAEVVRRAGSRPTAATPPAARALQAR